MSEKWKFIKNIKGKGKNQCLSLHLYCYFITCDTSSKSSSSGLSFDSLFVIISNSCTEILPENRLQVGAAKICKNVLGINTRLFTKLVRVIVHLGSPSKIIYYGPYKLPTKFQTFIRSVTISSNIDAKPPD